VTTKIPQPILEFLDRNPTASVVFARSWFDELDRWGDAKPNELMAAFLHDHPHVEVRGFQTPDDTMHYWLRHKQAGVVLDKRAFTRDMYQTGGAVAYDQFTCAMLRDWHAALTEGEQRAVREAAAALGKTEGEVRDMVRQAATPAFTIGGKIVASHVDEEGRTVIDEVEIDSVAPALDGGDTDADH